MTDFVYIMSASHSGSTLLTLLLAGHPEVATIGETYAVEYRGDRDRSYCSCGQLLESCPFWQEVGRRVEARGVDWEPRGYQTNFRFPGHRLTDRILRAEFHGPWLEGLRDLYLSVSPCWRSRSPQIFRNNQILIEEVMQLMHGRIFVDSSKEPHRLKFLMRIADFRTKVIHIVRDGRGVMASYMRRSGWSAKQAVDEWRRSIVSEEHMLARLASEQYLQLRYEDLCRDVTGNMQRILAFLGLDPAIWNPDFHAREHHILGNRMRMARSSEIRLDERWREELSAGHLKMFAKYAGRLNRSYGYD